LTWIESTSDLHVEDLPLGIDRVDLETGRFQVETRAVTPANRDHLEREVREFARAVAANLVFVSDYYERTIQPFLAGEQPLEQAYCYVAFCREG